MSHITNKCYTNRHIFLRLCTYIYVLCVQQYYALSTVHRIICTVVIDVRTLPYVFEQKYIYSTFLLQIVKGSWNIKYTPFL